MNHVEPVPAQMPVRLRADAAIPGMFTAYGVTADGLDFAAVVQTRPGDRPKITDLRVLSSDGSPITTTRLRGVLVDQLLSAAIDAAKKPATEVPELGSGYYQVEGEPANQAWHSLPPGYRRPGTDDRARKAAEIYVSAVSGGSKAPALGVATEMQVSRAQAARYIRRARELGLIAPLPKKG
ncbi:hypothetical protein [Amycolatopsis sp. NPDC051716]|uniref:hypothetical protein n=1 Tax=Amycolatopsis sp. NPDC051716 TaxID=3155804 RepID=UPI0034478217